MTQEELKELLEYFPDTGQFIWKKRVATWIPIGTTAGNLNKQLGYVQIRINKKLYYAHRLATLYMTGSLPTQQVDHINGVRADNRWENLRPASSSEQMKNTGLSKNNTSGENGVRWDIRRQKWYSVIMVNRKTHFLGYFDEFIDAVNTRKRANDLYGFHPNHGRQAI